MLLIVVIQKIVQKQEYQGNLWKKRNITSQSQIFMVCYKYIIQSGIVVPGDIVFTYWVLEECIL